VSAYVPGGYLPNIRRGFQALRRRILEEENLGRSLDCYFEAVGRGWERRADIELAVDTASDCRKSLNAYRSKRVQADGKGNVEFRKRREGRTGRVHLHVID